jgi:cytochrome b6-f complex iron-sulfur subunit
LSSICTHQNCTVGYIKTDNNLQCPCHGSVYAISGSVISGPAPASLRSYSITRSGDILTINS